MEEVPKLIVLIAICFALFQPGRCMAGFGCWRRAGPDPDLDRTPAVPGILAKLWKRVSGCPHIAIDLGRCEKKLSIRIYFILAPSVVRHNLERWPLTEATLYR